jgi:hypothetical protein
MKKVIYILSMLCLSLGTSSIATAQNTYGDVKVDPTLAKPSTEISAMLGKKEEINDVTITGTIKGVCQAKGCWMTVKIGKGKEMTVKFKDYAFFMPMDCAGKTMTAHGKAYIKITSVEELRHLAEDAGKSEKEIMKIKKAKKEIRFEADGVILS